MPDHLEQALDDDRLRYVEALVALARGEVDRPLHAGQTSCLDEHAGVDLVGSAAGHEHETTGAGLDAIRVAVRPGGKSSWAAMHVAWRHGSRIEAVITLEVDVPRSWRRRSRKALWYCTRDIPADRIRRLFGFVELARAAG